MEVFGGRLLQSRLLFAIVFFAAMLGGGARAFAAPWQFTYEGYLEKSDGTAIDTPTDLKFQILGKSGADLCVLREELQPQVPFTAGQFAVRIGSVAATSQAGTMAEIYRSSGAFTNLLKDDGGTNCTFDPAVAGAVRVLRIFVGGEKVGDVIMTSAPRALVAEKADDSATVGGKAAADLIQVGGSVTQAKLEQFFSTMTTASGNAIKWNGTSFVAYDPTNGASLQASTVPDSAIASVSWSKITGKPVDMTVGTTSGTVAAGDDSRFGNATKINGVDIDTSGVANGKVLTYQGSKWIPLAPTSTDATKLPLVGGAIAGSSSGNAILTVQNTHTSGYSAVGFKDETGALIGGVGFGNSTLATPHKGQVFLASDSSVALITNNTERVRVGSDGRVGIGKSAPAYSLDVVGDVNVTGAFKVNGANLATGGGTIGSVGISLPTDVFTNGTAITSDGDVSATFKSQNGSTVFAGPAAGGAGAPSFRALVADDLPVMPIDRGGTGKTSAAEGFKALSPLAAKGDLITHDGTNGPVRLGVGSDTQALIADSSTANGVKWGDIYAKDILNLVSTGIVQKDGVGQYSTLGVNAPLSSAGSSLGLVIGTGLAVNGASHALEVDTGTTNGKIPIIDGTGKLPSGVIPTGVGPWALSGGDVSYTSGKVGIGTSSPAVGLDVVRDAAGGYVARILNTHDDGAAGNNGLLVNTKSGATGTVVAKFATGSGATDNVMTLTPNFVTVTPAILAGNGVNADGVKGYTFTAENDGGLFSPGDGLVTIKTNGSEKLRVDQNGNVGIGTTNPTAKMHVHSDGGGELLYLSRYENTTSGANIKLMQSRGSVFSPAYSQVGDGNYLSFRHYSKKADNSGSDFVETSSIYAEVDAGDASTRLGGRLLFNTKPAGNSAALERMRIDSNGKVGIGTDDPHAMLHVKGDDAGSGANIFLEATGTGAGVWRMQSTSGTASQGPGKLVFRSEIATNDAMTLQSDGKIGIGTNNPTAPLQVAGIVQADNSNALPILSSQLTNDFSQSAVISTWYCVGESLSIVTPNDGVNRRYQIFFKQLVSTVLANRIEVALSLSSSSTCSNESTSSLPGAPVNGMPELGGTSIRQQGANEWESHVGMGTLSVPPGSTYYIYVKVKLDTTATTLMVRNGDVQSGRKFSTVFAQPL